MRLGARLRHNRSDTFDAALSRQQQPVHGRWTDVAADPNDPEVLSRRAATLRAAWRDPIEDRSDFLVQRCRGLRVLDVGCVAHDAERMASPNWLHARVAAVAAACLGVDVLPDGVEAMNRLGYRAVVHDLTSGPGRLAEEGPFDIIVAGELIEHVGSVDMLFQAARDLLTQAGELILTTPNPWAPHRVRAGQRGDVWENVDHILFAFPSGVAELAERHGLVLSEATTTAPKTLWGRSPAEVLRSVRRTVRGRAWVRAGYSTSGPARATRIRGGASALLGGQGRRRFSGETFVYVVRRPAPSH